MDISVIVACYNSPLYKLLETLQSIIGQKNVTFEIIVTDDGSRVSYKEQLTTFFNRNKFLNYRLNFNKENTGTCRNIYSALKICSGEYIKLLSPGDYLFSNDTLFKWILFMKKTNSSVSFGNAAYYSPDKNHSLLHGFACSPSIPVHFNDKVTDKTFLFNYLVLRDDILGASTLSKTDLLMKYLGLLCNGIKLAEDNVYRLMAINGIRPVYYNCYVIWYEHGTGVSSSGNAKTLAIINKDYQYTDKIMADAIRDKRGFFYRRLYRYLISLSKGNALFEILIRNILFPSRLFLIKCSSKTQINTNINCVSTYIDRFYQSDKRS